MNEGEDEEAHAVHKPEQMYRIKLFHFPKQLSSIYNFFGNLLDVKRLELSSNFVASL